jgi:hypothetical protein
VLRPARTAATSGSAGRLTPHRRRGLTVMRVAQIEDWDKYVFELAVNRGTGRIGGGNSAGVMSWLPCI